MKVREPVARPLDVILAELLLSSSQALLVGLLTYLAVGIWDERAVGGGPVAVILALLSVAVGGAWLYWLLGGPGWPLAAANAPVAMLTTAVLLLGLGGGTVLALEPLPLLLMLAASAYGIVAGVFLDPPRRRRWDQRERPRHPVEPPRISEPTRAALAAIARRGRAAEPPSPPPGEPSRSPIPSPGDIGAAGYVEAARAATGSETEAGPASHAAASPDARGPAPAGRGGRVGRTTSTKARAAGPGIDRVAAEPGIDRVAADAGIDRAAADPGSAQTRAAVARPASPRSGPAPPPLPGPAPSPPPAQPATLFRPDPGMELPTSVEPRAQRSPWAWARPPAWNRDEDDDLGDGTRT